MLPHFAGNVSYNLVTVFEFDFKLSTRQGLNDGACQLNYFLTRSHKYNLASISGVYLFCKVFYLLSGSLAEGWRSRLLNQLVQPLLLVL
jgi:hypothetical protein